MSGERRVICDECARRQFGKLSEKVRTDERINATDTRDVNFVTRMRHTKRGVQIDINAITCKTYPVMTGNALNWKHVNASKRHAIIQLFQQNVRTRNTHFCLPAAGCLFRMNDKL